MRRVEGVKVWSFKFCKPRWHRTSGILQSKKVSAFEKSRPLSKRLFELQKVKFSELNLGITLWPYHDLMFNLFAKFATTWKLRNSHRHLRTNFKFYDAFYFHESGIPMLWMYEIRTNTRKMNTWMCVWWTAFAMMCAYDNLIHYEGVLESVRGCSPYMYSLSWQKFPSNSKWDPQSALWQWILTLGIL